MSPRQTIRTRLWLAATLPALLVVSALLFLFLDRYTFELTQAWKERARVAALQLAGAAEFPLFAQDDDTLQRLVDAARKGDAQLRAAALFTRSGQPVAVAGLLSDPLPPFDGEEHVGLGEHLTVVVPIGLSALSVRDDLFMEPNTTPNGEPVPPVRGYAVIQLSLEDLAQRKGELLAWVFLVTCAALLLAGLLSTAIASSVSGPIRHISEVVARIALGHMNARTDTARTGALTELAVGINTMAARVAMTQEELRHQVSLATTELRQQKEAAEQAARLDPLTQVLGRRGFTETAETEIQRALRYRHPLSLIMIDLDHFKAINDSHGHAAGDAVLVSFAQLLEREVREWDRVGRLGGEEFAVLLPSSTIDQAMRVAERMREAVADSQISLRGKPLAYTASFGVAEFQPHELTLDSLLARADAALYESKRTGRNRVSLAPVAN